MIILSNKQAHRAEETKKAILAAAKELFSARGFDAVTIREIARKAKCSHTTIYLYFKDKVDLLHQLAFPLLQKLHNQCEAVMQDDARDKQQALYEISRIYVHFCFHHHSLYHLMIMANSSRIDEEYPETALNQIRLQFFQLLQTALSDCLEIKENKVSLTYARIFFYTLHGMVSSYIESKESSKELTGRLMPVLDEMVHVLLLGMKEKIKVDKKKHEMG